MFTMDDELISIAHSKCDQASGTVDWRRRESGPDAIWETADDVVDTRLVMTSSCNVCGEQPSSFIPK